MTPNIAVIQVQVPERRGFNIWLPLFLLWIPLILLSPIILLVIVVACVALRVNPWRAIAAFWALSCSLPGTDVRVTSEGTRVLVRIL